MNEAPQPGQRNICLLAIFLIIYIYVYIHMYTYIYIYIYIHIHINLRTCISHVAWGVQLAGGSVDCLGFRV